MTFDRRTFVRRTAGALAAASFGRPAGAQPRRPVPSVPQLAWQRDELAMFVHFGINTFTNREWGDGKEDPARFAPTRLDARQWARAARQAGHRAMILTAKHHDGFCLWPTRTTTHSVAQSPWRSGPRARCAGLESATRELDRNPFERIVRWLGKAGIWKDDVGNPPTSSAP